MDAIARVCSAIDQNYAQTEHPSIERDPEWVNTLEDIYIHAVEHGDNRYKRIQGKRFKYFIWITQAPTDHEDKLIGRAQKCGKCFYRIMKTLAEQDLLQGLTNI